MRGFIDTANRGQQRCLAGAAWAEQHGEFTAVHTTSLKLILQPGLSACDVQAEAESIVADELARINEFTMQLNT